MRAATRVALAVLAVSALLTAAERTSVSFTTVTGKECNIKQGCKASGCKLYSNCRTHQLELYTKKMYTEQTLEEKVAELMKEVNAVKSEQELLKPRVENDVSVQAELIAKVSSLEDLPTFTGAHEEAVSDNKESGIRSATEISDLRDVINDAIKTRLRVLEEHGLHGDQPTAFPTASPTAEPTPLPTAEPTTEPTSEPTPAPTHNPTPSPTAYPTAHPCDDGSHGCDKEGGGICYEVGHYDSGEWVAPDSNDWACACANGYYCASGCDAPHSDHKCVVITNAPTAYPTPNPTSFPTAHPCDDGTHGCDTNGGICYEATTTDDGRENHWQCDCATGYICVEGCSHPFSGHGCAVDGFHDVICGHGQYYADYTADTLGICKDCPTDAYSDGWTGVGETCKKHTLTCKAGEYLQGASSISAGECVTCPANTYNANTNHHDGSCDWHGQCPPGQEPSTLSKTASSFCSPCQPGFYSDSTSSHEMCKPWTVCEDGAALVGATATSAGTCDHKCHDYNSGTHESGGQNGQDVIYLDRHKLSCPDHQVLGAMGMSDFKLWRPTDHTISYKYRCCDLPDDDAAVTTHWSGPDEDGRHTDHSHVFLDRHSLDCGENKVIKSFELTRPTGSQIEYKYECVEHTHSLSQCSSHTTPQSDEGGSVIYLDRHNVDCPEASKPFLRYAKLQVAGQKLAYDYRCCP